MHQHDSKYFAHRPPHQTLSWGQIQLFKSTVMLHIKLKKMANAATYKHIFCPYTHPRPLGWDQRSKHFFLKIVMLHLKLIGMEH